MDKLLRECMAAEYKQGCQPCKFQFRIGLTKAVSTGIDKGFIQMIDPGWFVMTNEGRQEAWNQLRAEVWKERSMG